MKKYSPLNEIILQIKYEFTISKSIKKYTKHEIESGLALLGDIDRCIKTTSENDESLLTRFLFNAIIEHA